ncbi:hypothetical protein WISP_43436 [Willisornis vidua]|uniref:TPPP protein n=1 Tax=Willisornis vidua TaxID=1566151 RepID=A0ABQ9DM44_9PASS|nr:hypothetical protein WISP_43436 [Willisornis vidua]
MLLSRQPRMPCGLGKSCRTITFDQFKEALQELAKKRFKGKSEEEALQEMYKLIEGKGPVISGVTKTVSSPTVSRLTDTSKFTGSHKERFDASGKGKGRAGREDLVDNSGYVSGYKHAGTYDHKVQGNNVCPLNRLLALRVCQNDYTFVYLVCSGAIGDDGIHGLVTQLAAHLIPVIQGMQRVLVCVRWEGNGDMELYQPMT